ncbi:hypothetical protein MHTCC0001_16690 [Flavobacteriaceae bacterium MHTCC 0001]
MIMKTAIYFLKTTSSDVFLYFLIIGCAILYVFFLRTVFKMRWLWSVILAVILLVFFPSVYAALICIATLIIRKVLKTNKAKSSKIKAKPKATSEDAIIFRTQEKDLVLDNIFRAIYIQGGAGSGKSASFFVPILRQLAALNFSGILYDYKNPELTKTLVHHFTKYGGNVETYFVDFKNAAQSIRLNPLSPIYMTKSAYAFEHAQTLLYNLAPENIKSPNYFTNDAKSILTAIIWYLKSEYPQYCTLPHVISLALFCDMKELIPKMSENMEVRGMLSSIKEAIDNNAGKQVAGVLSTLKTNLSKLNIPDVFWLLSGDDVDLDINNPNNPKFLCIGTDSVLSQTYAPVISLIISVAIKQMNMPNKHKSAIVIDELPTIYIEAIDELPAVARSNRISTILGVQDFSQLVLKYGREKSNVILSNMGNQFFGRTVTKESAQMVKELFGKADKIIKSYSEGDSYQTTLIGKQGNNSSVNTSFSNQERDRVKISDITNLQPGQFYGFIAEGSETEVMKAQFLVDKEDVTHTLKDRIPYTERHVYENYLKIIEEANSIIGKKEINSSSNSEDLINF